MIPNYIVRWQLKDETVDLEETVITRQRWDHVSAASNQHAVIDELLEAVFLCRPEPSSNVRVLCSWVPDLLVAGGSLPSRRGVTISRQTSPFVEEEAHFKTR
jgi:hypothetical protein